MTATAIPRQPPAGEDGPRPGEERVVPGVPPFDAARLDALLGEADADAVVTTSRQAAQSPCCIDRSPGCLGVG